MHRPCATQVRSTTAAFPVSFFARLKKTKRLLTAYATDSIIRAHTPLYLAYIAATKQNNTIR